MQRFFTQTFTLMGLVLAMTTVSAQTINTLTVNSPDGIKGDYLAVRAQFGSQSNTPITGNAGFTNDGTAKPNEGCNKATNNVTGLIKFIDRGTCEFGIKALRAQESGAAVAIICNNAEIGRAHV